ncbi:hypothetical protein B0T17DRAFT_629309 [Bombardia bombarda]|uniref:Hemerythrin-like domain-containing protein n=1 Tax=Bombardia bombarda TaxID=252184 RepID=A0AA39WBU8_9PEZI|nr:hypothetical protein B0T17DRAFT_629309 [Bombardia bombarda]
MYRLRASQVARPVSRAIMEKYSRPLALVPSRLYATDPKADRAAAASPLARVSDSIKRDHEDIKENYFNIIYGQDYDTQVRWQNQFIWDLARHSIAEEIVVYPAFEKYIPDGEIMADRDRCEHMKVKEKLFELQNMTPAHDEFLPTLNSLWEDLSRHIKEEETEDLPQLEKHIDSEASNHLANSFSTTKHFVPTRSHPMAPDKPPYETAVGLLTTPMDKLMDMFKRFPKEASHSP